MIYVYAEEKGYINTTLRTPTVLSGKIENFFKKESTTNIDHKQLYKVVHVADGDTIDINKNGTKVRVRLLGINSPESVAQNRPDECFGKEAGEYMKKIVQGKNVRMELDSLKPEKDEYGRVLAYVWLEDGLFVNRSMIENGYAYEYTYKSEKYKYQSDFKSAQKAAREASLGLWAQATCDGKK